jgi:hypothetical protein
MFGTGATVGTVLGWGAGAPVGRALEGDAGALIGVALRMTEVCPEGQPRNSGTRNAGASIGLALGVNVRCPAGQPRNRGTCAALVVGAPVGRTICARLGVLDGPTGGTIDETLDGTTMVTSEGAIDWMLDGAPTGELALGSTLGSAVGLTDGADGDMVGVELGTTEGSTYGMMVGELGVLAMTGSGSF